MKLDVKTIDNKSTGSVDLKDAGFRISDLGIFCMFRGRKIKELRS